MGDETIEVSTCEENDKTVSGDKKKNIFPTIINITQIVIAIVTLVIAIFSYLVAQRTYDYASLDFSIIPKIEKSGDTLVIKNSDTSSFRINSIVIDGYESWYVSRGNGWSQEVHLQVANHQFDDEKLVDLNNVKVNLNECKTNNGRNTLSSDEQKKFEDTYNINLSTLQAQEDISYNDFLYQVNIQYFNKKSYRSNNISLNVQLADDGSIEEIIPSDIYQAKFNFVYSYNDFRDEWDRLIEFINNPR